MESMIARLVVLLMPFQEGMARDAEADEAAASAVQTAHCSTGFWRDRGRGRSFYGSGWQRVARGRRNF